MSLTPILSTCVYCLRVIEPKPLFFDALGRPVHMLCKETANGELAELCRQSMKESA